MLRLLIVSTFLFIHQTAGRAADTFFLKDGQRVVFLGDSNTFGGHYIAYLDAYLARCGQAVLSSVGCYYLEGEGAQLFERIEGDYFAILGLSLIGLLEALRREEALPC